MRPRHRVSMCFLFLVGVLIWGAPGWAQTSSTGSIIGLVTDPSGAVIPGATVEVTRVSTNVTHVTTTDAAGTYRFPLLPPGDYTVKFSAKGFKALTFNHIVVTVTETATLNGALPIGSSTQTVTVQGGAKLLQTQSSTVGGVVSQQAVNNLPLTTRNYTQILGLVPGVTSDLTDAGTLGRNTTDDYVNGMRTIDNTFSMDGVVINNFGTGRAGDWLGYSGIAIPNPDAIQEFQVQTALYDAQYGRGGGANVDVVTKTGTNQIHGDAFEYLRNTALDADDFFLNSTGQPRPVLRQNQFGFTLGGPIKKDKLFYFGSYQGTRQTDGEGASSLASSFLPPLTNDRSASALGSEFCGQKGAMGGVAVACDGSNINPVALALLNYKLPNGTYFIPTPQEVSNGEGFSVFSVPSIWSEDQIVGNVDAVLSRSNTLSAHWFSSRDPQTVSFTTATVPGSGATTDFQNRNLVLRLTSSVTSHLTNEALLGFNRNYGVLSTNTPVTVSNVGMTPVANLATIPIISVDGLFGVGGSWNDNFKTAVTAYSPSDHLTWIHGAHSFRFGVDIDRTGENFDLNGPKRGDLTFLSFPDFLLGMSGPQNGTSFSNIWDSSYTTGITDRELRVTDYSSYFEDAYQARQNLTLNIGLRWDVYGGVYDKNGVMSNFWPSLAQNPTSSGGTLTGYVVPTNFSGSVPSGVSSTGNNSPFDNANQWHNFEPRFGLAWTPLNRLKNLVVRAGYGIYYTRTSGNDLLQLGTTPPYSLRADNTGALNSLATFQDPWNPAPPPVSAFPIWLPRTLTSDYAPEMLAQNFASPMSQQYSLNVQYQLARSYLIQVGYVGNHATGLLEARNYNQPGLATPQNPINGQTTNTVENENLRVPILGFAPSLYYFETNGNMIDNSLQASLTKRFDHGFLLQASYTFAKILDDVANGTGSDSPWGGFFSGNADASRHLAWGPADFNRPQRLVLSYVWQVPSPQATNRFEREVVNGWSLSGDSTFQSGTPITINDARAATVFGAFFFSQMGTYCPGMGNGNAATHGSVESRLGDYLNANAFCAPPTIGDGTGFGDVGRGVVYGPGNANWDVSVNKLFNTPTWEENSNIEFIAEFFNFFNTPQFANPASLLPYSNFGQISSTSVSPRIIQMALKFNF
ncbi:MAG: carboxypeptidase regulatory-like domain-containing protein [Candidatus Acidiferrales bacterium]